MNLTGSVEAQHSFSWSKIAWLAAGQAPEELKLSVTPPKQDRFWRWSWYLACAVVLVPGMFGLAPVAALTIRAELRLADVLAKLADAEARLAEATDRQIDVVGVDDFGDIL